MKRADADLYNRALRPDAKDFLLDHVHSLVRDRETRISNVANLVNNLPPRTRVRAIKREENAIVSWAGDAPPSDSVGLIQLGLIPTPSGLQVDSRTRPFLRELVGSIASQCESIARSNLTAVPNRLRQLGVIELEATAPVVLAMISSLSEANVIDQVCQRVLWDIAAFSARHRVAAVNAAEVLLSEYDEHTSDSWSLHSVLGTVVLVQGEDGERARTVPLPPLEEVDINPEAGRWQNFRVITGVFVSRGRQALPPTLIANVSQELNSTATDNELSMKLLTKAREILAIV